MRVSPSHSRSSPPLKKYVTCAYFSVSATWSWRAPALREHLGERVLDALLLERDGAREVRAVAGHRRQVDPGLEQPLRELARTVGPEVEEDRRVPGRVEARPPGEDDRLDELVGDPALVARAHCCNGVIGDVALPLDDGRERAIRAIPALVAVHRVVTAADRRDPLGREPRQVVRGGVRRDVATVGERVDPRVPVHALPLGEREQRTQMVDVRVDSARGDEPEQVDVAAVVARALHRGDEGRVLEERPARDRAVHAHEVLEQDAAGADREVADLGVPHLPRRKPDRLARGRELGVRVPLPERVEDRRVRELDRVPRSRGREPPTVEDDEDDEVHATAAAPARQIASKDAASSDAPPTSAPSTSGCARSTAAFSGFTDPP